MISTLTDYHNRENWLAARRAGIGASEVSALFGLSPWASMFSLWSEKTGLSAPMDIDGEWLHWGSLLEGPIAARYEHVTGRRLWTGGSPFCIAQHDTIPVLRCTPDRLVVSAPDIGQDGPGDLQIKNAAWFKEEEWSEGPPPHIAIQVQAELACLGAEWASVAVLVGGNKFRYFDIARNQAMIEEIESQVTWFWGMVESRTPPEIDASEATTRALKRLHPLDDGSTVALPPDAAGWLDEWLSAKATISEAEKSGKAMKEAAENKLRHALGPATFGVLPDGRRLTLKHTTRAGYTVEETTFRTLRLETKKGK